MELGIASGLGMGWAVGRGEFGEVSRSQSIAVVKFRPWQEVENNGKALEDVKGEMMIPELAFKMIRKAALWRMDWRGGTRRQEEVGSSEQDALLTSSSCSCWDMDPGPIQSLA